MSEQSPPPPPPPPYGQPGYGYVPPPPTPSDANTALILGIVSVVLCGAFTGIPAIVIGRRAMREIDDSQGALGGRSNAQAGFVLGIVGTVLMTLGVILLVALVAVGVLVADGVSDSCPQITADPAFSEVSC